MRVCLPLLSCAAVAVLAGCSQIPAVGLHLDEVVDGVRQAFDVGPVPVSLAPAPRPRYQRGDTFFFGRTTMRQLRSVSPKALEWTTEDGDTIVTTADFFAPYLGYTPPGQRVESRLKGDPSALWPLEIGKRVSFEETRRITHDNTGTVRTRAFRWQCEVVDARLSIVPAGDFDTFHVRCRSFYPSFPLPLQEVSWDYAPSLGHFVRRTWLDGRRTRELQLTAALPGRVATERRRAAVRERLAMAE